MSWSLVILVGPDIDFYNHLGDLIFISYTNMVLCELAQLLYKNI